jgi:hypothetical protein
MKDLQKNRPCNPGADMQLPLHNHSWTWPCKMSSFLRGAAVIVIFALMGLRALSSESSSIDITIVRAGSPNEVFVLRDGNIMHGFSAVKNAGPVPGLIESNGLYRINIEMPESEPLIPAGTSPMPYDMNSILEIYAILTKADLRIEPGVKEFRRGIMLPEERPAMTRSQAAEMIEAALREQASVEVVYSDAKHAVVRFQKRRAPSSGNRTSPTSRGTE